MFSLFTRPCHEASFKKFKYILLVLAILAFVLAATGCTPQKVYVKQTEYVYTPIPKRLVKKCVADAPVSPKDYVVMSRDKKEETLINYSGSLLGTVSKCNDQLGSIEQFDVDQQKLIKEKNDAAKETR